MDLETIMLSDVSHAQKDIYITRPHSETETKDFDHIKVVKGMAGTVTQAGKSEKEE